MIDFQKVLILAPHTDDGELGCGGTISKLISKGKEVFYVAFSAAERSVDPKFPSNILRIEVENATKILGIPSPNLQVMNFPVRDFPKFRQDILENLITLNNQIKPDIVFMPSTDDTHQDHQTIFQEGFRAFKKTTILGYELPWNNLSFKTGFFINLSEQNISVKVDALSQYKSQEGRPYCSEEFIRSLASVRGIQIGTKYAEAFETIRIVVNN